MLLIRFERPLPFVWKQESLVVSEKIADVIEDEAAGQIANALSEKAAESDRGSEASLFVAGHYVREVWSSIKNLDLVIVARDGHFQVDAVALQHGDLVLP